MTLNGPKTMMSSKGQPRTQRVQPLKTYSRRVPTSTEEPPTKKRRVEEPEIVAPAPPAKIFPRSSIQSYFKPLAHPSSPSKSTIPSSLRRESSPTAIATKNEPSDPTEPSLQLPSFSPPNFKPPLELPKSRKKLRRRLTTRPNVEPLTMISKYPNRLMDDDEDEPFDDPSDDCSIPNGNDLAKDDGDHHTSRRHSPPGFNPFAVALPRKLSKLKSYQQLQIDLGGPTKLVDCSICRMEYNPTVKQDSANHDKFHKEFLSGLKLPYRGYEGFQTFYEVKDSTEHRILVIDHRAGIFEKQHFEEILKRSYRDLCGTPITFPWEKISNPQDVTDPNPVPRYRLYVYFIGGEAVSLVLAERIGYATPYYFETKYRDEGIKSDSEDAVPAKVSERVDMDRAREVYMSVDRVWTIPDQRRKGYATKLIDVARETFINGLELSKNQISFSPPTRMGHKFAAKYCDKTYADEDFDFLVDAKDLVKAKLEHKSLEKVRTSLGNMKFHLDS